MRRSVKRAPSLARWVTLGYDGDAFSVEGGCDFTIRNFGTCFQPPSQTKLLIRIFAPGAAPWTHSLPSQARWVRI
jgi:hypothetical protein